MGEILSSRVISEEKIILKILLNQEEVLSLKNAFYNINIFTEDLFRQEAKIIKKGNKGVTKFFEIPFSLRSRKKKDVSRLSYQKLETSSKVFYLYVLKKDVLI